MFEIGGQIKFEVNLKEKFGLGLEYTQGHIVIDVRRPTYRI